MAQVYQVSFTPHVTYVVDVRAETIEQAEALVRQNWREMVVDTDAIEHDPLVVFIDPDSVRSDEDGYEYDAVPADCIVNVHGTEIHVGDTVSPREDNYDLYFSLLDEVFTFDSTTRFTVKAINWCDDDFDDTLVLEVATENWEAITHMTFNCCPADDFDVVERAS